LSLSALDSRILTPRLAAPKAGNRAPTFALLFSLRTFVLALPLDDEPSYCAVVCLSNLARSLSRLKLLSPLRFPFAYSRIFGIAAFFSLFLPFELTARLSTA